MAKELKGTKTEKNLQAAFAGESQAHTKYLYYASKAKKDGYVQIAQLFEETVGKDIAFGPKNMKLPEAEVDRRVREAADFVGLSEQQLAEAYDALGTVPYASPKRLDYLSGQLFANAVYVSDSSHELFILRDRHQQQNYIGSYISALKSGERSHRYPLEKENELYSAKI